MLSIGLARGTIVAAVLCTSLSGCGGDAGTPAANGPPVAQSINAETVEDVALSVDLTATDADGDILSYSVTTAPSHGSISGEGTHRIYMPSTDYHGPDQFGYSVSDGKISSEAVVTLEITAANDAPVAAAQSLTTAEDVSLGIALAATDVDADTLVYSLITQPTHGVLTGTPPNLTYLADSNYSGGDSFMFQASDGQLSSSALVAITITPVNDAPVAQTQAITVTSYEPVALTLHASDADGDTLSYSIVSGPSSGSLSGTPPNLSYTATGGPGTDHFSFQARDPQGAVSVADVQLDLATPNARVQLGVIGGAKVAVYRYPQFDSAILSTTSSTSSTLQGIGYFKIPTDTLEDASLYLIVAKAGKDYDANNDGQLDATPTSNLGKLHAVVTGAQIKRHPIILSAVSEAAYHRAAYLMSANFPVSEIEDELDARAPLIFSSSVDGDSDIDAADLAAWNPAKHASSLTAAAAGMSQLSNSIRSGTATLKDFITLTDTITASAPVTLTGQYIGAWSHYVAAVSYGDGLESSLQIFDVADSAKISPVSTASVPYISGAPVLSGTKMFYMSQNEICMLELADPKHPQAYLTAGSGTLPTGQIAIVDDLLYAASPSDTYAIFRIANNAAPVRVETGPSAPPIPLSGAIAIDGQGSILLGGSGQYLSIGPDNNQSTFPLPLKGSDTSVRALTLANGHILASSYESLVDIAPDGKGGVLGTKVVGTCRATPVWAGGLLWSICGEDAVGFSVPANSYLSAAKRSNPGLLAGIAINMTVLNDQLYWFGNGLIARFDQDRAMPKHYFSTSASTGVIDIELSGDTLYAGTGNGVQVYSLTDHQAAQGLSRYSEKGTYGRIGAAGTTIASSVLGETNYVSIISASDPTAAQKVGKIDLGNSQLMRDAVLSDSLGYLLVSGYGSQPSSVMLYDFSDPASPYLMRTGELPKSPEAAARPVTGFLYGSYLFVADSSFGLRVLSKDSLSLYTSYAVDGIDPNSYQAPSPIDVNVQNDYAYLASGSKIQSFALAKLPLSPAASYVPMAYSSRFLPDGAFGYAFSGSGMTVLDISNPAKPVERYAIDANVADGARHGTDIVLRGASSVGTISAPQLQVP
jgi:hypothetical protein